MEDPEQYYVMDIDGVIIGPVASNVLTHLATKWQIGPDSPIRRGDGSEWVTFRDVAAILSITLPDATDWRANRKAAIAKEKSDKRWGCAVFLVIGWIGMTWIGLGFLFVPFLMYCVLYYSFCKLFEVMTGLQVLGVPMWTDVRVKRIPGQGWDFLAMALAMSLVMGYYLYRIMNQ